MKQEAVILPASDMYREIRASEKDTEQQEACKNLF